MAGRVRAEKCLRFWIVLLWAAASTACATAGLERAVWEGDYDAVERAVSGGGGVVNQRLDNFQTPLHIAAASGNLAIVRLLVANGADVHARSPDGSTPLHRAAYTEHIEVVRFLVEQGSDVNARDRIGDTPLHNAAHMGFRDIVELLVARGADVERENTTKGYTPLHDAVSADSLPTTLFLMESGADVNGADRRGETPLHLAAHKGTLPILEALVEQGADVNHKDARGMTPLHNAVLQDDLEVVEFLISSGADASAANDAGKTPADLAFVRGLRPARAFLMAHMAEKRPQVPSPGSEARQSTEAASHAAPRAEPAGEPPAEAEGDQRPNIARGEASGRDAMNRPDIDFGPYHALVIGNNAYRSLPELRTARRDARVIADLLGREYGFSVSLLLDATREDILLALENHRKILTGKDNFLIYYAGHGWLDREADEGYWLPINASPDNPVNWIPNSTITAALRAIQAKHILVVSDSCYSGKLSRGVHMVRRAPGFLERIAGKKARSVLSSGGLEPVIDVGGAKGHSVFASAFIDALRENEGIMDGTKLFSRVRRPVMLNSDQTPEYADIRKAGHSGGDFLFVRIR